MNIKSLVMLSALTACIIPMTAFADMNITNNTNTAATAFAGISPCSNAAGERGIIQPHGQVTIPDFLVGLYCTADCKVEVFMTKNCSGKSISTVTANVRDGVKKIDNHNTNPDGSTIPDSFRIEGSGKNITIEGGPARKWYQLLF